MARHKDHDKHQKQRDTSDIATDSDVLRQFIKKQSVVPRPIVTPPPPKPLRLLEDRRTFHPDKMTRPAGAVTKKATRLRAGRSSSISRPHGPLPHHVGFSIPKQVAICIRRKIRKQVLFAKNKTRKGSGSRRNRNEWSDIVC